MSSVPVPSTGWQEKIAPDEEQRYAEYARQFAQIQARKSARWGTGRTLHRKQLTAAHGTLEVLDGLPAYRATRPVRHAARSTTCGCAFPTAAWTARRTGCRTSEASRCGCSGCEGESALGNGPARSQDFTLINQEVFALPRQRRVRRLRRRRVAGQGRAVQVPLQALRPAGRAAPARQDAQVGGQAVQRLCHRAPVQRRADGQRALRRAGAAGAGRVERHAPRRRRRRLGRGLSARGWRAQPLHWDLQLQFFASEALTPIEDASVNWPTPYTTVARLMLPKQDCALGRGPSSRPRSRPAVFDPWQALAEHRPLGDVQRARKVVYFESQKGRGAA